MDSTTTTTDTKTPKTRKTRKVLTKKEKEDCRAATEQLEAIFKGGPRPFELRPGALNLVVSKLPEIVQSDPRTPPSRLNILAVLLAGPHLYAYYNAGYNGYYHIGRLDTLTGTWESSIQTLYTSHRSKVVAFNFDSPEQCSSDPKNSSPKMNQPKPKPLNHLQGFLIFTQSSGVTVRTLGDFDREERVIGHHALLQTMEPPAEERPEPAPLPALPPEVIARVLGGGGGGRPAAEGGAEGEVVDPAAAEAAAQRRLERLQAAHAEHLARQAELNAQLLAAELGVSWLAAAVDRPGRAVYVQAEVGFGQQRLMQARSFFRLDLSGSAEATDRPWRRLEVPFAETIPPASALFTHHGRLYLVEVKENAAEMRRTGTKLLAVSHLYCIDLATLAWSVDPLILDPEQVEAGTARPLVNLVNLEFAQVGAVVYCLGTERDEREERKKGHRRPQQPHLNGQPLSTTKSSPSSRPSKQQKQGSKSKTGKVSSKAKTSTEDDSSSSSTSPSPPPPPPPPRPKFRNVLWALQLDSGILRLHEGNAHLEGRAALMKPMMAAPPTSAGPGNCLWAVETADGPPARQPSLLQHGRSSSSSGVSINYIDRDAKEVSPPPPSAGPGCGVVPANTLPLFRIPLGVSSLRALAADAFFARPPRGLLAMAALEERLRQRRPCGNDGKVKVEVKEEVEEVEVVNSSQAAEEVQYLGVVPAALFKTYSAASEAAAAAAKAEAEAESAPPPKRKSARIEKLARKRQRLEEGGEDDDEDEEEAAADGQQRPPLELAPVRQAGQALVKRFLRAAVYPEAVFRFPPAFQSADLRFHPFPMSFR